MLTERQIKNFEKKFDKIDGCWQWKASQDKDGYGHFEINTKMKQAHRVSYEFYNGSFDSSLKVLHSCDNPSCVNPDHLFLGSQKDNIQDMIAKGRYVGRKNLNQEVN